MGKKTIVFSSKEQKSREDVAAFLRELADRVAEGSVLLKQGESEVELTLPEIVRLEVEAEYKDKKQGKKFDFEIELEWYEGQGGDTEGVTLG